MNNFENYKITFFFSLDLLINSSYYINAFLKKSFIFLKILVKNICN